ncbi:MAG: DUF4230 domain-containing protein [Bacillota bacterium]|nr:DUF4230 domain-containing protein [Bacillota bacterium]
MKKILAIIIALVIGFAGGFIVCKYLNEKPDGKVIDSTILSEEVIEISELSTIQDTYENQVPYQGEAKGFFKKPESFLNEHGIHIFDKELEVKYKGILKFGLDMSNFSEDDIVVDVDKKTVTATIPKSKILSHEINEDSWEIIDERNGLFNPLTPKDDSDLRKYAKEQALEKIDIDAKLAEADEKAVEQITKLLEMACPGMEVIVTTK